MKKSTFSVIIYFSSFEDNWNDGEVSGTWEEFEYDREDGFDSLEDAIKFALFSYGDNNGTAVSDTAMILSAPNSPLSIIVRSEYQNKEGIKATEREIKAWKAGKINLWNTELKAEFIENKIVEHNEDVEKIVRLSISL